MVTTQRRVSFGDGGRYFGVLLLLLVTLQTSCVTLKSEKEGDSRRFRVALAAAKRGEPTAQLVVAEMFGKGEGTKKDCREALLWMERAAKGGQAQAQLTLGTLLCQGYCGRRDLTNGLFFVRESGMNGDARIRKAVARVFGRGTCGVRSKAEAYAWLVLAGDEEARIAVQKLIARMTAKEQKKAEQRLAILLKELQDRVLSPVSR